MSTTQMSAVQKRNAEQRMTLRRLFDQQKPELSMLLPKGMSVDRFFRIALTEVVKNPDLLTCSAESWALALQVCAAQGLYPDSGMGYMYLIPRGGKVTTLRGYKGDIKLARRSGEIADIYAEVVYQKDTFKVRKGTDRALEHEPYMGTDDPGALVATYAVAKLKSGETTFVVLFPRDIERHKKTAQGLNRADSPWNAHPDSMWKKTAIHELSKWLPCETEDMERVARGEEAPGAQTIDTTAMTIPIGDKPAALEAVKDKLRDEQGGAPPAAADDDVCPHAEVPPSMLAGVLRTKTVACEACGEELQGTMEPPKEEEREPGADDDVETIKTFVEQTTAQPDPKAKPKGQGRLGGL